MGPSLGTTPQEQEPKVTGNKKEKFIFILIPLKKEALFV
jgi:hypothetical protein